MGCEIECCGHDGRLAQIWRGLCWTINGMTNTEFISREKGGHHNPLFRATQIRLSLVDGAIALGFLAAFVGLVFLLSK